MVIFVVHYSIFHQKIYFCVCNHPPTEKHKRDIRKGYPACCIWSVRSAYFFSEESRLVRLDAVEAMLEAVEDACAVFDERALKSKPLTVEITSSTLLRVTVWVEPVMTPWAKLL